MTSVRVLIVLTKGSLCRWREKQASWFWNYRTRDRCTCLDKGVWAFGETVLSAD